MPPLFSLFRCTTGEGISGFLLLTPIIETLQGEMLLHNTFPPRTAKEKQTPLKKIKGFVLQKWRGESKAGVAPAFVVSIRGSFEGGRNRNLPPSNVILFLPFSWTSKRKGNCTDVDSANSLHRKTGHSPQAIDFRIFPCYNPTR